MVIQKGLSRGIFSSAAGDGCADIAQAAGFNSSALCSGLIGMMGTFIDTIIVCALTGQAIMVSGVWIAGKNGAVVCPDFAWLVADTHIPLMANPNLISLQLLSPVIAKLAREHFA